MDQKEKHNFPQSDSLGLTHIDDYYKNLENPRRRRWHSNLPALSEIARKRHNSDSLGLTEIDEYYDNRNDPQCKQWHSTPSISSEHSQRESLRSYRSSSRSYSAISQEVNTVKKDTGMQTIWSGPLPYTIDNQSDHAFRLCDTKIIERN